MSITVSETIQYLTVETLQALCRRAASIHESSYTIPESESWGQYSIDMDKATEMACRQMQIDPRVGLLISLALSTAWNDVLDWASIVLTHANTQNYCTTGPTKALTSQPN